MSIDLYVFPTSLTKFSWSELKSKFLEISISKNLPKLEKVSLYLLDNNKKVSEDKDLSSLNDKDHIFYYLNLDIPNNLGISILKNESNYISEVDLIEDFGRNLSEENIQALINKWKSIGHVYGVTSMGGRNKHEPSLFVTLALAIAHLCQGYVIVMSNDFNLDVGVYSAKDFKQAKMIFDADNS